MQNQTTLDTLARNTQLVEFIHQHGDKLGELIHLSGSSILASSVQIYGHMRDNRVTASALLAWFYLLDDVRLGKPSVLGEDDAYVSVHGRLKDHAITVHSRFRDNDAAYVLGLPEMSVHALRRVQVGDMPAGISGGA